MVLSPSPSLDLVIGLPVLLLLAAAGLAVATFVLWGRFQRR